VVRKHEKSGPKQPTGLKGQICDVVKTAGKPLITKKIAEHFPDRPFQTVNSATNALVQAGWLRDSGKRESTGGGGRDAIAYEFDPNLQPKKQGKKSAKVVDFRERKLVAMIEDQSICKIIESWAANKSKKQCVEKAYQLVVPLIGKSRGGILALADEQERIALAEGRVQVMKL
jgi:hypothetical protein